MASIHILSRASPLLLLLLFSSSSLLLLLLLPENFLFFLAFPRAICRIPLDPPSRHHSFEGRGAIKETPVSRVDPPFGPPSAHSYRARLPRGWYQELKVEGRQGKGRREEKEEKKRKKKRKRKTWKRKKKRRRGRCN